MDQGTEARARLYARRDALAQRRVELSYQLTQSEKLLTTKRERQTELLTHVEEHRIAAAFMQELLDKTAARNIAKVEDLVNTALSTVFPGQGLEFRIFSEVKRNINTYRIAVIHDGLEGTQDSFGGGVFAVVALVLRVLFNLFSKRYPLLCFDESLKFVSEEYVPATSRFIADLSRDFGMPIVVVTHHPTFAEASHRRYVAESAGSRTVRFKLVESA